jgi:hypothetical protein
LKRFWLLMCVVGTVLPYAMFIPWALKNGLDMRLLIDQVTPPIAAFAWLDVAVSAVVVLVLAIKQIVGGQSQFWLVVVGTCGVAVSLGLPLYLYLDPKSAPTLSNKILTQGALAASHRTALTRPVRSSVVRSPARLSRPQRRPVRDLP